MTTHVKRSICFVFLFFVVNMFITNSKSITNGSNNINSVVYVCTGPKAEVYHSRSNCKGLSRCSGTIKKMTLSEAIEKKRRACKLCYKIR